MARAFLHKAANRKTFSGQAAIWISVDVGVTWLRMSNSSELTITPETNESEALDNAGHGHFDDCEKNYIVEGKFLERGEDVRQLWDDDADQDWRGVRFALWIQGAQMVVTGNTKTYEQWCFYQAYAKRNFGAYAMGSGEPMFTFSFYCEANSTCASVTIPPPCNDPCFLGLKSGAATIDHGEFKMTFDSIAA